MYHPLSLTDDYSDLIQDDEYILYDDDENIEPITGLALRTNFLFGLLPDGVCDKNGVTCDMHQYEGRYILLYFSAGWCLHSRLWEENLVLFQLKNPLTVQVSADVSSHDMLAYIQHKPWPAVKYHSSIREELPRKFGIMLFPSLAVLSPKGSHITNWGLTAITNNSENCISHWENGNHGIFNYPHLI